MRRTVTITALAVLAVVVALSLFLATRHPITNATLTESPLLGKPAPSLSGTKLGGGTFNLRGERGKVVVVNFWASWCGPCKTEAPNLSTFAWQERHRGVVVVGVVFDDRLSAARQFAALYGSLYPSVVDPGGVFANRFGVTSPPTTFVVNAEGLVEATLLGPVSVRQLEDVVARVKA